MFIGHGVKFVNDDFKANIGPAKGNKKLWKSTKISENVNIGSGEDFAASKNLLKNCCWSWRCCNKRYNRARYICGQSCKTFEKNMKIKFGDLYGEHKLIENKLIKLFKKI